MIGARGALPACQSTRPRSEGFRSPSRNGKSSPTEEFRRLRPRPRCDFLYISQRGLAHSAHVCSTLARSHPEVSLVGRECLSVQNPPTQTPKPGRCLTSPAARCSQSRAINRTGSGRKAARCRLGRRPRRHRLLPHRRLLPRPARSRDHASSVRGSSRLHPPRPHRQPGAMPDPRRRLRPPPSSKRTASRSAP